MANLFNLSAKYHLRISHAAASFMKVQRKTQSALTAMQIARVELITRKISTAHHMRGVDALRLRAQHQFNIMIFSTRTL